MRKFNGEVKNGTYMVFVSESCHEQESLILSSRVVHPKINKFCRTINVRTKVYLLFIMEAWCAADTA